MPVSADETETALSEALYVEELEQAAGLEEYGTLLSDFNADEALKGILHDILKQGISKDSIMDVTAMFMVVLLCSLVRPFFPGSSEKVCNLAGSSAAALLFCGNNHSFLAIASETLTESLDIGNVLLPTLGSAALLSGQITAATARYTAAGMFLNVMVHICVRLLLPMIRFFYAMAIAETIAPGGVLSAFLGFLKWGSTMILTGITLAFSVCISLTGLSASAVDAAVLKSAKTALSTLLPVVGGIASDAAGALISAAAVIRNAVGIFGGIAVLGVLALPFVRIGIRYLLIKGVGMVSAGMADAALSQLLKRFAEGAALTLGCIGVTGLLLFFSVYTLCGATIPC